MKYHGDLSPISPANSSSFFMWNDGTKTATVPFNLHRPAHCKSCSMLKGKPTTIMCPTPEMSSPVPAHDVPTIIWTDSMYDNGTESLLWLVTIATNLNNELLVRSAYALLKHHAISFTWTHPSKFDSIWLPSASHILMDVEMMTTFVVVVVAT